MRELYLELPRERERKPKGREKSEAKERLIVLDISPKQDNEYEI